MALFGVLKVEEVYKLRSVGNSAWQFFVLHWDLWAMPRFHDRIVDSAVVSLPFACRPALTIMLPADMLMSLLRKERELGIKPDPAVDAYLKARPPARLDSSSSLMCIYTQYAYNKWIAGDGA